MKRFLIAAVLSFFVLTGCSNDVKDFLLTDVTGENAGEKAEDEVTFVQDDFAFYTAGENDAGSVLVGLGMRRSQISYDNGEKETYLNGFNIEFRDESDPMHTYVDSSGKPVDMEGVSYISYDGGRKPVMTVKGIRTTGLANPDTSLCSDVQEVIDRYGIDTEKEDYMTPSPSDPKEYTIQLYFREHFDEEEKQNEIKAQEARQQEEKEDYQADGEDVQSNVKYYDRIVYQKGETPGDTQTDYSIRFVISGSKVIGIQMYKY